MMLVRAHAMAIRRLPICGPETTIVGIVEANHCGIAAKHILRSMSATQPFIALRGDPNSLKYGVTATKQTKADQVRWFRFLLRRRMVRFDCAGVTVGPAAWASTTEVPHTWDEMIDRLIKQVTGYRYLIRPGRDPFAPTRAEYTGKIGNKQDDLFTSLLLAIYFSETAQVQAGRSL